MRTAAVRTNDAAVQPAHAVGPLAEVRVDDTLLRYVDVGSGEPVLLLHGYAQSHLTWRKQIQQLARTHRVLALDWFGWGQSGRNLELSYSHADEVARLGRTVDALGLDRFNLVAHDYGALLALGYAPQIPERLLRLGIISTRAHGDFLAPYRHLLRVQTALCRSAKLRRFAEALPWQAILSRSARVHRDQGCFDAEILEAYLGWLKTREGRRWLVRYHAHYQLEPMTQLLPPLARIACPTTVLWGSADRYCGKYLGEEVAMRIPGARIIVLPGADHFVMEERPAEVLRCLEELLSTRPTTRASLATPSRISESDKEA